MSTYEPQGTPYAYTPVAAGSSSQIGTPAPDPSQVASSSTPAPAQVPTQPQSRQAAEEARKDRTLAEFLLMLDDYEPLVRLGWCTSRRAVDRCGGQRLMVLMRCYHSQIPNEVTDYYLQRVGFECEDVRL